jgi:hypothetical protein
MGFGEGRGWGDGRHRYYTMIAFQGLR